jgi:hypothetical protein
MQSHCAGEYRFRRPSAFEGRTDFLPHQPLALGGLSRTIDPQAEMDFRAPVAKRDEEQRAVVRVGMPPPSTPATPPG